MTTGIGSVIEEAWGKRRAVSTLHVDWLSVWVGLERQLGVYRGIVDGRLVVLVFEESYELSFLPHSNLRIPSRTRRGLVVCYYVVDDEIRTRDYRLFSKIVLSNIVVRGESMSSRERLESRRRNLEARTLRVFGFEPSWRHL